LTGRRGVSPTVRRRRLGAELRRYRETAGLTIEQVAEHMDCSASKISRLETGQIGSSPHDVREILTLYRVGDPELSELIEVAKETRQRGWWQQQNGALTSAFVAFEQAASVIRSYEAQCVPGLLQTEEYARNLLRQGCAPKPAPDTNCDGQSGDGLESRIRVRLGRRALLTQEDPVRFWCVIDEAALLRPVGSHTVMRQQIRHLASMSTMDNVTLQVLPLAVGAHPGMDGSFVVLGFPHDSDPDTVYVTMATGGVFQEKPDELSRYNGIFARLTELALGCEQSTALLRSMA
jgi:transcriptional regulator with XRE-family HTH domain